MKSYTKSRRGASGEALPCADLPLFQWAQAQACSLMCQPAVRHLVRRTGISPTLALVYAELFGLGGRHEC